MFDLSLRLGYAYMPAKISISAISAIHKPERNIHETIELNIQVPPVLFNFSHSSAYNRHSSMQPARTRESSFHGGLQTPG